MAYDELTKESYTCFFKNNFELAHYAIKKAQEYIRDGGEDLNVSQLLKEIRKSPPKIEDQEPKDE